VARLGSRYYAVVYGRFDARTDNDKYPPHDAGDTRKSAEKWLADAVMRLHDHDRRSLSLGGIPAVLVALRGV
jgi:hypothetical protein